MAKIDNIIISYDGEEAWLSNFANVNILYEGNVYPSVEHAYMSAKSDDIEWKHFCADIFNSAAKVKRASRNVQLVKHWDDIKINVMNELLLLKFNQEPFKSLLLETNQMILREGNTWNDKFWGCTMDGEGENHLGKLQMKIRNSLNTEPLF